MIRFETFLQDVRYGARALLRERAFTTISVFTLALGIGVNTAVFTAYRALIERSLDAQHADRMANFALQREDGTLQLDFSYPDYEAYRDHLHSFSDVITVYIDQLRLSKADGIVSQHKAETGSLIGKLGLLQTGGNGSEIATTFVVSENYFKVLGVGPVRGRGFDSMSRSDLTRSPSVLISENYWQRRFGGDPVLGKNVRLNGAVFTIVGVTPHNFSGTSIAVPDFWLPFSLEPLIHPESKRLHDREDMCCRVFGRLAPGVSLGQAQAETTALAGHLRSLHDPESELSKVVSAYLSPGSPLPPKMDAGLRFTILLIMVAAGMVLLIACANAASLQLARATSRRQELGIRLSIGASRARLIRQLLTESALLAVISGSLALPVTSSLLHVAATRAAEFLPIGYATLVFSVSPDREIFAYVLGISVFAGVLFGIAPALESSRSALLAIVRGAGISSVRSRLRYALVAVQVAISLALLASAGTLVHSAIQTLRLPTGYEASRVIDLSLQFPEDSKYTASRKMAVVRNVRGRIAELPGVTETTIARGPDEENGRRAWVSLNGEAPSTSNKRATIYYTWVQANYFETLGIPMALGRGLSPQAGEADNAVVISESAAKRLWPGLNPIGRSLRLGTNRQFHLKGELLPDGPMWRVSGVARDTRGVTLDGRDSEQVYVPLPPDRIQDYPILIRTRTDAEREIQALDAAISGADPRLVGSASTLEAMLRRTDAFLADSLSAVIAGMISVFALLLAAMGIYGAVSYIVALRTREVGIRMALGAQRSQVFVQMIRESSHPVVAGLLAGIILAGGAAVLLRGVLYGVGVIDPISLGGACLLFLAIALVATWPPSRRATRVDPMVALRYE